MVMPDSIANLPPKLPSLRRGQGYQEPHRLSLQVAIISPRCPASRAVFEPLPARGQPVGPTPAATQGKLLLPRRVRLAPTPECHSVRSRFFAARLALDFGLYPAALASKRRWFARPPV